ncbi:putative aspartate-semialdehyde dehydrogenase [Trichinella spiralis]|uniref:putative aspartate-semialdehyde dehydrogenase n=1 Tax=Trichinella spiralis TaxID=6334 RepID=UPI0001EFEF84|nr:putative aspartate-semialdehyde dehydrogenase [Trichinella spiralis]
MVHWNNRVIADCCCFGCYILLLQQHEERKIEKTRKTVRHRQNKITATEIRIPQFKVIFPLSIRLEASPEDAGVEEIPLMNMSAGKVWHWPTRPLDRHEASC